MPGLSNHSTLIKFYQDLQQDIRSAQISEEDGGTQEQLFTMLAASLLAESGESENVRLAYDEKVSKSGVQHKVNGYAIADNYETLDLLISIFNGTDSISVVSKGDIDRAAKRVSAFFKNATKSDYARSIEESSEIFQLAQTLVQSKEIKETLVRVNAVILTDGIYEGRIPENDTIAGYAFFYKVVDLNYLYNISEKAHTPIEIDFNKKGFKVPCIKSPSINSEYQTYLAIIPGEALVSIYEEYGSRLLEQNVRSFLQFTGKVNGGIRKTILTEPHMFLAFNNGLAATADGLKLEQTDDGMFITEVSDLQIVNGGQTTASIYHTWRKDKKDVSEVFVQVKLSVIKNKEKFNTIVGQISEFANTQNKVSVSDLSSNRPFHIDLEKLSRDLWAPPSKEQTIQTRWFYERARGQYKNARLKEGNTLGKQRAFDIKNPKGQVFTKEDLAKYVNSYKEVLEGRKLVIGPHYVVRGNQKNYIQFMQHNVPKEINVDYYEDLIAKMILFRTAEKLYGVKPNAIGDMRYITVPYAISYLSNRLENKLDLFRIWQSQSVSANLKKVLYDLMVNIEDYIKTNAPGSLYGEWAKKEECWQEVRSTDFDVKLNLITEDIQDERGQRKGKSVNTHERQIKQDEERLKLISSKAWRDIESWGKETKLLTVQQQNIAWNLSIKGKMRKKMSGKERYTAISILDIVLENEPSLILNLAI